jgi:hypothetical protein
MNCSVYIYICEYIITEHHDNDSMLAIGDKASLNTLNSQEQQFRVLIG